jgi:hypothetical protein
MCDSDGEVEYRDAFPVFPTNRTINPTDPIGCDNLSLEVVHVNGYRYVLTTSGRPYHNPCDKFDIKHYQTGKFLGTVLVFGTHDVKNKIKRGTLPDEKLEHMVFK